MWISSRRRIRCVAGWTKDSPLLRAASVSAAEQPPRGRPLAPRPFSHTTGPHSPLLLLPLQTPHSPKNKQIAYIPHPLPLSYHSPPSRRRPRGLRPQQDRLPLGAGRRRPHALHAKGGPCIDTIPNLPNTYHPTCTARWKTWSTQPPVYIRPPNGQFTPPPRNPQVLEKEAAAKGGKLLARHMFKKVPKDGFKQYEVR